MKMFGMALLVLCSAVICSAAVAQAPESPVEYMSYVSERGKALTEKYMSYMAAVAHSRRAKKMEKRRLELVEEIRQNLTDISRMKPYKGDATLKNAYKKYYDLLLKVFNEDYHKIVNMEEIAEQSYDAMEAYMIAQEQAGKVVDAAHGEARIAYHDFAARNNVTIRTAETKEKSDVAKTNEVMHYYNQMYLLFFKVYKQEAYVLDAVNKKDINGTEQNRLTLIRYAKEGLSRLDTTKAYANDKSLIVASREVFNFYIKEGEVGMASQIDYLMKRAEFDKLQKAMEATPANKRKQEDIDAYNKAVNEMNAAITASNKTLTADNETRSKLLEKHNEAERKFLDTHVPK
jgi:hypothetical protein